MTAIYFMVVRLCLKSLEPLEKLSNDDWMVLTAVVGIALALFISHKVHMITGR